MEVLKSNSEELTELTSSLEKIENRIEELILALASKEWLTTQEVCENLGLSKMTLRRLRKENKMPFTKLGRKVFFSRKSIDGFLEKNERNPF